MSVSETFARLVEIMAQLRGDGGCPWDREQTHETIRPYCLEEAYEVVEAIDENDAQKLRDELGDLLLQVVFHSQLATEEGTFSVEDVIRSINEKLIRRHPHVFQKDAGFHAKNPDEVLENWSKIKKKEGREHLLDGIPHALPALLRATRMGEKAATVGFDWPDAGEVWKKVDEEIEELRSARSRDEQERELGDLFFALTSLARHLGFDAESSLRKATEKFDRRFRWMEKEARSTRKKELSELSPAELDALWNRAKGMETT
jgi:tetrapyrrole methylase family protein / MazG family protein